MTTIAEEHSFEEWEEELKLQSAWGEYQLRQHAADTTDEWMTYMIQMNPKAVTGLYETAVNVANGYVTPLDIRRMQVFAEAMGQAWLDVFTAGKYRLAPRRDME